MKNILALISFSLLIAISLRGNVAPPRAYFSELAWDESGNWIIEIGFYVDDMPFIDSIIIESTTGSARIIDLGPIYPGLYFDSLAVITNNSLASTINIDPENDLIIIHTWAWAYTNDQVPIGSHPGSYLDCFNMDESLSRWGDLIHFDSSPTIGEHNGDTTGTSGMFSGVLYDPQGIPMIADYFGWYLEGHRDGYVSVNPDGNFSDHIYRRHNSYDEIWVKYDGSYDYTIFRIEPHDYCMEYGYNHHQDVITLYAVGVDEVEPCPENLIIPHPNPFHDEITFTFDKRRLPKNEKLLLKVMTLNGKLIDEKFTGGKTDLIWSPGRSVPSGVFVYQVFAGDRLVSSGKMIKR